jgi:hypothetical protein
LQFAEKKEVKDRLKEFNPPAMSNYVDPGTIDAINKAKKKPPIPQKKKEVPASKEHADRI